MTRTADRSKSKKHSNRPASPKVNDVGMLGGIVLIGIFVALLGMFSGPGNVTRFIYFYALLVIALINLSVWQMVLRGRVAPILKPLARLPLRFVGFGLPKTRPLEAAKGEPAARQAAIVTTVVSLIVIVGAALFVFRTPEF